jgi:putative CocE/NonD family hydrolase
MKKLLLKVLVLTYCFFLTYSWAFSQNSISTRQQDSIFVRENYQKFVYNIPMRDGTKLYTTVYVPKDASDKNKYPMLMQRTCYSVAPYGENEYETLLSPSRYLMREKYIVVYQDVRGRWMSEGTWTNMTPHIPNKKAKTDVDEASDTYDTIDWLIKNVKFNNGRVGQWGISYPGYYAIAGALAQHPALKASSPQAPIADFFFDDFHHNGAFTLGYFLTFPVFGVQHPQPTPESWYTNDFPKSPTPDGFEFYKRLGSLKNGEKYYPNNFFWKETVEHPHYDEFWQKRNILPHLKNVKHAMMIVGGWFDAEDLYGPLNIYKTLEKNNIGTYNTLVMGPFGHGDWAREQGRHYHNQIYFGDSISTFYQKEIELKFFNHFLKGAGDGKTGLPEAYLFDTGKKQWRTFNEYPVKTSRKANLYFQEKGKLTFSMPTEAKENYSEFVSDPNKPVPSSENLRGMMNFTPRAYMSEDQRFASKRTDVLTFETEVLTQDVTLGGELTVNLNFSTTGTDADWIVKLVDVYADDEPRDNVKNIDLGNYQQMVRSEIMRSRFRNSFEKPEPLTPDQVTTLKFRLQDVLHTFKKGHKIMIQVQSTCFPLFDRNPQKYVDNIYKAEESDFIKATHRVYHTPYLPSFVSVEILD